MRVNASKHIKHTQSMWVWGYYMLTVSQLNRLNGHKMWIKKSWYNIIMTIDSTSNWSSLCLNLLPAAGVKHNAVSGKPFSETIPHKGSL